MPAVNNGGLRITYLQNPHVEIVHATSLVGEGIKKTLAYDTPLNKDGLEKWRQEFWGKILNTFVHVFRNKDLRFKISLGTVTHCLFGG